MTRRETSVRIWSLPLSPVVLPWLLLPLSFLLGGVSGHLISGVDFQHLSAALQGYSVDVLTQGSAEFHFSSLLWRCLEPLLVTLVLSFSALGVLGLPILLGVQGFRTGYAISGLSRTWGISGLGTAALWIGVEDMIRLALLLAIAIPGWSRAWELATQTRLNRRLPPGYRQRCCAFCLAGLAVLVVYEYLLCESLMPVLVNHFF